jgi:Asp/Glu/hydantoin racemase
MHSLTLPAHITLIHATPLAIEPINAAFNMEWPNAVLTNVLDDSLSRDLERVGRIDDTMNARFAQLVAYGCSLATQGIVFTCSAFGPAIENARANIAIPVMKPNEAMFEQALTMANRLSGKIGLLTTFSPAARPMREELFDQAKAAGMTNIALSEVCAPDAFKALAAGDTERHDALIAKSACELAHCDVIMLGQFSMARALNKVTNTVKVPVLTSPQAAVRALQQTIRNNTN